MTERPPFMHLFTTRKPLLGMLHLRATADLSPLDVARTEIDQLIDAGIDGLIVENYFGTADDAEQVLDYLASHRPHVLYGVNILRDYERSFRLASRYGARLVQLDSVAGHLPPAGDASFAASLEACRNETDAYVLGGVRFKYQPYLSGRTLAEDLGLARQRCDAIVVTGPATGVETDLNKIAEFRALLGPDVPLLVGAGLTVHNASQQLASTDGAIVGSYLKQGHIDDAPVDPRNARRLVTRVRQMDEHAG